MNEMMGGIGYGVIVEFVDLLGLYLL